jgi:hypothetical protein
MEPEQLARALKLALDGEGTRNPPPADGWRKVERRLRREPRRRAAIAAVAAIMVAALAIVALQLDGGLGKQEAARRGLSSSSTPPPRYSAPATPAPRPPGWVRHTARSWPQSSWPRSPARVSIDTPASWHFNSNPAPALLSPTMLFAVGTGPVPTGGSCAPTAALKALPANGALFVLYDSAQYDYTHVGSYAGYPPRPRRMRLGALGGPYECWGVKGYVITFEDGGRYFQAQVVFGPHAPASLRAEVSRSLNTLQVAPLPAS